MYYLAQMKTRPAYIVFAGINGAGKTTLYKSNMWQTDITPVELHRVNPDEIIRTNQLNPNCEKDQLKAGKIAVRKIDKYFKNLESFSHETVLAGRSSIKRIEVAKEMGYCVIINYVGLKDCQLAINRIAYRVQLGGHNIDSELVRKRWNTSLENLKLVCNICDEVHVFDNTNLLKEIAMWHDGTLCWWGANQELGGWLIDAMLNE